MTRAVLILAAGASSRMRGGDKLLEDVDGMPLVRRMALEAAKAGAVYVALPCPGSARRGALEGLDAALVDVPDAAEGMGASIRAGVRSLPPSVTQLALLPGDMPEITGQDITAVFDAAGNDVARGMAEGSTVPGHPVVVPRRLFPDLTQLIGDEGAKPVLQGEKIIPVILKGRAAITDLDTPEAWTNWRASR